MHRSFIEIDGHRLETVRIETARKDAETLVFLHPSLGSIDLWRDFPSRVAAALDMNALVYSRYGHGRSTPFGEARTPTYLHHEAQVVLPEVLNAFAITAPILYGHSDGGTIALLYAATFPESTPAIVVEAPHIFVEKITVDGVKETLDGYQSQLRHRLAKYHDDVDATFSGWSDIWLDTKFADWNIEEELRNITCPVLAIQGEDDQYGSANQVLRIQQSTPRTEVQLLPACKHAPNQEQPELVIPSVLKFLRYHRTID